MQASELLDQLFPGGHQTTIKDWLVDGDAEFDGHAINILGTTAHAFIGGAEALELSSRLLDIIEKNPGSTILMLVDNSGQRMALSEELLILPEYIAHLLKAQQLARESGCKLIGILYGTAVAGGFIAFGMLADRIIAVPGAEPSVMKLEAIARVTKMPLAKLQELAKTVSVFAPGCDSFFKMGGVHDHWDKDFPEKLRALLAEDISSDVRAALGNERGGRTHAQNVIERVISA